MILKRIPALTCGVALTGQVHAEVDGQSGAGRKQDATGGA